MESRLNLLGNTVTARFAKYLNSANKAVADSGLPPATQELVKLRASQINGCAYCTDIADAGTGVSDDAWANAAKHYDDDQLGALVALIAEINAWNRLNVITRQPAGDYQPGQWG